MKLIDVYKRASAPYILYQLLQERTKEQSISHKEMPGYKEHFAFVMSKPYKHWYLIDVERIVGATYISKQDEIGLFLFNSEQGKGYGKQAVTLLRVAHPGPLLANVSPDNPANSFWRKLGGELIQHTYRLV